MSDDMLDNNTNSDDDLSMPTFNVTEVIKQVSTYESQKLSDMIICDRYLGILPKLAEACMIELAKRRENGDTYDFEGYIEKELSSLPVIDLKMPDLAEALNQVRASFR
jgi:hypothetical protein